jgi:hypothetical protein
MSKERFYQIIDEVYNKYLTKYVGYDDVPSKELFLFEIKNNTEFSEKWGLKIEERELSEKERIILAGYDYENRGGIGWNMVRESVDMDSSIPTKLITLTYNNEIIESYE